MFLDFMQSFDINSSSYTLEYKKTGTSLGLKIAKENKTIGKWAPKNEATDVEAQVVAYQLARFLNMSDLAVPSAYYAISGAAIEKFKDYLESANEKNSLRKKNQQALLEALSKKSDKMLGVYMDDVHKAEALEVANPEANTINSDHPIAKFIKANGPVPSATKTMSLKGVKTKEGKIPTETELELARSFSKIMVLDMLTGQWDRWSGGNVEATWNKDTLKLRFFARDNGGAGMTGTGSTKRYLKIVSRFDRDQIERVKQLKVYLDDSSADLAKSLLMRSSPDSLKSRVEIILDHVKQQEDDHGDKAFF